MNLNSHHQHLTVYPSPLFPALLCFLFQCYQLSSFDPKTKQVKCLALIFHVLLRLIQFPLWLEVYNYSDTGKAHFHNADWS